MDIEMPGLGGIEATRRIKASGVRSADWCSPCTPRTTGLRRPQGWARGYLLKGGTRPTSFRRSPWSPEGVPCPAQTSQNAVLGTLTHAPAVPFPQLTERENEVLELLADGLPNQRIASRLGLSVKTVANHVSNILTKLSATDRTTLILQARKAGLGKS